MKTDPVRVLVVDDSAFARKVVREVLTRAGGIEVVGIAGDGLEALEKIAELRPDVITLDLIMPNLDGLGLLRQLAVMPSPPRVVVVSISGEDSELVVEALQLGAFDSARKPTALATDRLYDLASDLPAKVLAASKGQVAALAPQKETPTPHAALHATHVDLVVVGTSTGGPQALTRLLTSLPADFPVAMAIALHIPVEYTASLAKRLDAICELEVVEAHDGLELQPGRILLARGGIHLAISMARTARLTEQPTSALYCPSVDVLFKSAALVSGARTLGVVLTGMGDDGCAGARAIVDAGGRVLTEAESSCVVYGMPRAVDKAGLSAGSARIDRMGEAILQML